LVLINRVGHPVVHITAQIRRDSTPNTLFGPALLVAEPIAQANSIHARLGDLGELRPASTQTRYIGVVLFVRHVRPERRYIHARPEDRGPTQIDEHGVECRSFLPSMPESLDLIQLAFGRDHAGLGLVSAPPLRFERLANSEFEGCKYYCFAPLKTEDHLELLTQFERAAT